MRLPEVQRIEVGIAVHAQDHGLPVDDELLVRFFSAASTIYGKRFVRGSISDSRTIISPCVAERRALATKVALGGSVLYGLALIG